MVAPVTVLEVVQAGLEATPGTAVAATRVVDFDPGSAILKRTIATIKVPRAGSRSGDYSAWPGIEDVEIEVPFSVSTDDWPWWANLFIAPLTTGTGAGNAKTYAQTPPDTNATVGSAGAVQSATFQVGGKDTWPSPLQVAGCIGKTLDLTIRPEQVWKAKAVVQGMVTTQAALTGALTNRAIAAYATGPQTKVYLDTSSAFGATQLVGRGVSADVKLDIKPAARHTLDGTTTPFRLALPSAYQVDATVVAEFAALTELNNWAAKTSQRLRLGYVGPSIPGGSFHTINLDIAGPWDTFDIVADKGVWVASMKMTQIFDSSISAAFTSTTINAVSPLP